MKVAILLGLLMWAGVAFSKDMSNVERWICQVKNEDINSSSVELTSEFGVMGKVGYSGVEYDALIKMDGLDKLWFFGDEVVDGVYKYLFIIDPEGRGGYYETRDDGYQYLQSKFHCRLDK